MDATTTEPADVLEKVLKQYGLISRSYTFKPLSNGLVNSTWKVQAPDRAFILQRINENIFHNPFVLADNVRMLSAHLASTDPQYLFPQQLTTLDGREIVSLSINDHYRLFHFIDNSVVYDTLSSADQAYEAARQFATFTGKLSGFSAHALTPSIPHFHNLTNRYMEFEKAMQLGNRARLGSITRELFCLIQLRGIVKRYQRICKAKSFRKRVMHHDAKISNVLFDQHGKGLCVIDLDTVMPGFIISDIGDMMRTYLSPVSEEERDITKIELREDFFKAIVHGYVGTLDGQLTGDEKESMVYAGIFMTYMQALRFIGDYLLNDRYYGARYEEHNLVRGLNQLALLKIFLRNEGRLCDIVRRETTLKVRMATAPTAPVVG